MLEFLRKLAGLPEQGPADELMVWIEEGPNAAATWSEALLDWSLETCGEVGIGHGDVLVVQEHPSKLPSNAKFALTAPEYIRGLAQRR